MAIVKRNITTVLGLDTQLTELQQGLQASESARGNLGELQTANQDSLVAAINEVLANQPIVPEGLMVGSENLSELTDVTQARVTLEVYSQGEVDQAIAEATLGLGSTYDVADLTERDALVDLTSNDRVFVADDGDGKWAIYRRVGEDWLKLADQDSLENAISGAGIKSSYESNPNTNAFEDEHLAKVNLISVTTEVDLDAVLTSDDLVVEIGEVAEADQAPSAAAVKQYVDTQIATVETGGGSGVNSVPVMETLTVAGDSITLTSAPSGGIAGVMNFATVRHYETVEEETVAYDVTIAATEDPLVFTILADTPGEWDGREIQIQYLHLPEA